MNDHAESGLPRRRSLRLRDYDYTRPGAYFVTICAHRRACLFGHITEETMHLNAFGKIIEATWHALPSHYPNVEPDAFVIMPNHVHGILVLDADTATLPKRHGLPEIIRAFKTFASRRINQRRGGPGRHVWQRDYYEHVIRMEDSLSDIRDYIETNPLRWHLDRENPANASLASPARAGLKPAPTDGVGRSQ
jgi:REP element-mobilizing transposase RayT